MPEFYQKIFIAVLSTTMGGLIGFGSNYYFNEEAVRNNTSEFSRKNQFDFLKEIYDERKSAYLEVEKARRKAINDPTDDNMNALVQSFFEMPIVKPRLPTNMAIIGFQEEVERKISTLNTNESRIKFLNSGMNKYSCIFDVNLQTIEFMMTRVASSEDSQQIGIVNSDDEFATLDQVCYEKIDTN